jgi:fatty-acyl-CoA synthase
MAWVQLRGTATATEEEIRAYCKARMAHFKVPRHVWFVSEFPMTVTGKLQKFRMREIAAERMAALGQHASA